MNRSIIEFIDQESGTEDEDKTVPWPIAAGLTLFVLFFLAIGIAVVFTVEPYLGSQAFSASTLLELWALAITRNPSDIVVIMLAMLALFLALFTIVGLVKAVIVLFFDDLGIVTGAALGGGIALPVVNILLVQRLLSTDGYVLDMSSIIWRTLLVFLFGCLIGAIVGTPLASIYRAITNRTSSQMAAVAGGVGTTVYVILFLFLLASVSALSRLPFLLADFL